MSAGYVTLVTGGVRSGKSRHAEALVRDGAAVTYVATGPAAEPDSTDDSDTAWAARVAAHRARRPASWVVVETLDVATAVREAATPVVVDCLGTWLTGLIDAATAWDDLPRATEVAHDETSALVEALRDATQPVVVVTNEVGLAPVALSASGRWFQDELGRLNAAVATVADGVHLVVAGRVLDLSDARPVG